MVSKIAFFAISKTYLLQGSPKEHEFNHLLYNKDSSVLFSTLQEAMPDISQKKKKSNKKMMAGASELSECFLYIERKKEGESSGLYSHKGS